jgi:hypothetical protein
MFLLLQLTVLRAPNDGLLQQLQDLDEHDRGHALALLEGDKRVELISRPNLLFQEGQPARMEVGRRVPRTTVGDDGVVSVTREDILEIAVDAEVDGQVCLTRVEAGGAAWSGAVPTDGRGHVALTPDELFVVASATWVDGQEAVATVLAGASQGLPAIPDRRRARKRALRRLLREGRLGE